MEAKPKKSPWLGSAKRTSWPSASIEVTWTRPLMHDEGAAAGVAGLVDALPGGEVAQLDLRGEDG